MGKYIACVAVQKSQTSFTWRRWHHPGFFNPRKSVLKKRLTVANGGDVRGCTLVEAAGPDPEGAKTRNYLSEVAQRRGQESRTRSPDLGKHGGIEGHDNVRADHD